MLENVPNILTANNGHFKDEIYSLCSSNGYTLWWRKIIQNVSVYDDHFVICFKSGIEKEVWFNTNINRQLRVRFSWLAVFALTFTWFIHVILSKMLFIRLLIRSWPHEWCNKLLDEAIKETENLYEGEVFIFKELFKGYVWNRIPRKDCTNVLVDVFEIF